MVSFYIDLERKKGRFIAVISMQNWYINKRPHLNLNMKTSDFINNKKPEKLTSLV